FKQKTGRSVAVFLRLFRPATKNGGNCKQRISAGRIFSSCPSIGAYVSCKTLEKAQKLRSLRLRRDDLALSPDNDAGRDVSGDVGA
ncbi:MAG: hypothetical protein ACK57P_17715, partial [Planctomycetota bacterium]